jgi:hypothetical protein
LVGIGLFAPYCLYQFYSLWKFGMIYAGPFHTSHWMSFREDPFWFVVGLSAYGFFLLMAVLLVTLDFIEYLQLRRHQQREMLRPHFEDEAHRGKERPLD